jgi:hypothetical protein
MPTRYLEVVQPKSKLAIWAWSPVIVLRIALVSTYMAFVYASVVAFFAGVPVFNLTTFPGWTPVWAGLLAISAVLGAVGSITDRWQQLEKWATLSMSALFLAYIAGLNIVGFIEHDLGRQFAGAVALIAGILPMTRFVYLAAQSGKKRVTTNGDG